MPILPFWSNPCHARLGASAAGEALASSSLIKRSQNRAAMITPTQGLPLLLEVLSVEAAALHIAAWTDLTARGLEPNVFMEPAFCLAAARHLALAQRPTFLFVWELQSDARRLLAVCPLVRSRLPLGQTSAVWFHDLAALGAPLLDRHFAGAALQAILSWLARRRPACGALMIHALPIEGPTARVLQTLASTTGRGIHLVAPRQRAVLRNGADRRVAGLSAVSHKRAKELGRQRRRLGEIGDLHYSSASGGDALHNAVEAFLRLEASGWKGRKGTALLMHPGRIAFARTMTHLLARDGKCRVDSLALDGVPIAMGIILSSGGRDFFWKTAYAADYARLSPGVHFVLGLTEAQQRDPAAALIDSCAIPDHPMIDRLWPDRLGIADMLVAVRPGQRGRFLASIAIEESRQKTKSLMKRGVRALRGHRLP